MATLTENVSRIVNGLDDIKDAIIEKGGTVTTGKCEDLSDDIRNIPQEGGGGGGTDVSDTTATSNDVLEGKIFHLSSGARAVGKIKNYENQTLKSNVAPTGSGLPITISGNYKNGTLAPIEYYVPNPNDIKKGNTVVIDERIVVEGTYETPNFSLATAFPSDVKKGKTYFNSMGQLTNGTLEGKEFIETYTPQAEPYANVTIGLYENVNIGVDGVSITDASHLLEGDALVTKDIEGNITSTITEGTMPNIGAVAETIEGGETYTIPEGYHNGTGTVTAIGGGGGGGKVASGTFTTWAESQFIECGFRPTKVMVMTNIIPTGSTQGYLQLCQYWEGQSNAIVIQNLTNVPSRNNNVFITPVENGFNFIGNTNVSSQFQGKTAYYIAVG